MDDLTYTLRQLCQRNRDGSYTTQADRMRSLSLAARQLREAGFRQMMASSLKGKHVQALLERWQGEGLSSGTIKNRLSHLRWWAEKIGKAGILPADNTQLGVPERRYVTNISKAQELGTGLEQITDVHVRMSLQLQAAFGLRREEAIKFQPCYADRSDHIALKGSWTKGGRERIVPITTAEQRDVLHAAHRLAGTGSLIPADKTFIQQRHVYDGQCKAARAYIATATSSCGMCCSRTTPTAPTLKANGKVKANPRRKSRPTNLSLNCWKTSRRCCCWTSSRRGTTV